MKSEWNTIDHISTNVHHAFSSMLVFWSVPFITQKRTLRTGFVLVQLKTLRPNHSIFKAEQKWFKNCLMWGRKLPIIIWNSEFIENSLFWTVVGCHIFWRFCCCRSRSSCCGGRCSRRRRCCWCGACSSRGTSSSTACCGKVAWSDCLRFLSPEIRFRIVVHHFQSRCIGFRSGSCMCCCRWSSSGCCCRSRSGCCAWCCTWFRSCIRLWNDCSYITARVKWIKIGFWFGGPTIIRSWVRKWVGKWVRKWVGIIWLFAVFVWYRRPRPFQIRIKWFLKIY